MFEVVTMNCVQNTIPHFQSVEYYYRYISDIVDVRKGKHAVSYYASPNMSQKVKISQNFFVTYLSIPKVLICILSL